MSFRTHAVTFCLDDGEYQDLVKAVETQGPEGSLTSLVDTALPHRLAALAAISRT